LLEGVNRSKVIVVINKDAGYRFFKAADYGCWRVDSIAKLATQKNYKV